MLLLFLLGGKDYSKKKEKTGLDADRSGFTY